MKKQGEIEKGKANNFKECHFLLFARMFSMFWILWRGLRMKKMYLIERLRLELAFICTYVQLSYSDLEQFEVVMTAQRQRIEELLRSIFYDGDSSAGFKSDMHREQLNFLLLNLHHLSKHQYLEERMPSLVTQYEILQNVCGNVGDFHGLILNGCVEHDNVEYVLPQFQHMADRVGLFLWDELILEHSSVFKLAHLLLKIIPIEHMMCQRTIHHDKLFDLLARVGALIREISTLVRDLDEESKNKESTYGTNCATRGLLDSIELLKEDLKHEDLEFIRSSFVNIEQELNKVLWARVLDVAYEAKDVIDSIIVRDNGLFHLIFSLPITIKKIKLIKEDVFNLLEKIPKNRSRSGKTTLAYKVYNDESVCSHFDLRAWCTFDQEYDEKKLKQLYGKRYLIVLDDVWDTTTWDDLTRPFPEVVKGSRIILTTRQKEVAFHGKGNTDPLNHRLLRLEESWELLEKRAFGKESCPDELLDIGKEIAQNCKGLPLVADLTAGVIAGLEKKKSVWLEVRNNLNSFILNSEVEVMKVIELSYEHLPDHLKPCFLYLARYLKDKEMNRDVMKMHWRAEGLVEQTGMKSLEEVMEIYLDNLISSSLVISFNEIGDDPTCQLHDLVHDFCLIKAKEEKLFEQISSRDPSFSSELMPRIVNIDYNKEQFKHNNFVLFSSTMKRHSGKHLYSLFITGDKMEDCLSDACHLREASQSVATGSLFYDGERFFAE
ncbi:hypothetical protein P3S67_011558 [Capsicum chacoense]